MALKKKPPGLEFDIIDDTALMYVIQAFDIGTLLYATTLVIEGDNIVLLSEKSETSRKLVIHTDRGRFFLKQVPWYCDTLEHIQFSHRFMTHLSDASLPVPRLLSQSTGLSWIEVNGSQFTLSESVTGSPYQSRFDYKQAAAASLASMHVVAQSLPLTATDPCDNLESIVRSHVELALKQPGCSDAIQRALEVVQLQCDRWHMTRPELLTCAVHGDFIPWNLAFKDEAVAAIYDFDNSCLDARLHDIGEAIVAFFGLQYVGQSSRLRPRGWCSLAVGETYNFLRQYELISPLSQMEWEWLPAYVLGAWWECLLLSFIRGEQPGDAMQDLLDIPTLVGDWWAQLCQLPRVDWPPCNLGISSS